MSPTEVIVRDRSSGRIHRRTRYEGAPGLQAFEGCNADAAGEFDELPTGAHLEAISDVDVRELCARCFPGGNVNDAGADGPAPASA